MKFKKGYKYSLFFSSVRLIFLAMISAGIWGPGYPLFSLLPTIGGGWTSPASVTADTPFISDGLNNYEWPDVSRDGYVVFVKNRRFLMIKRIIDSPVQSAPSQIVYTTALHTNYTPPPPTVNTSNEILFIDAKIDPSVALWSDPENKTASVIPASRWVWIEATGTADIDPFYVDPSDPTINGKPTDPDGISPSGGAFGVPYGYLVAESVDGTVYNIGKGGSTYFQLTTDSELKFFVNDDAGFYSDNIGLYSVKVQWTTHPFPQTLTVGGDCDPPNALPSPMTPPAQAASASPYSHLGTVVDGDHVDVTVAAGSGGINLFDDQWGLLGYGGTIGLCAPSGKVYVPTPPVPPAPGSTIPPFQLYNTSLKVGRLFAMVEGYPLIYDIGASGSFDVVLPPGVQKKVNFYVNDYKGLNFDNVGAYTVNLNVTPEAPPAPPPIETCLEIRYPTWTPDGNFIIFQKVVVGGGVAPNIYYSGNLAPPLGKYLPLVFSKISIIQVNALRDTFKNPSSDKIIGAGAGTDYDSHDLYPSGIANYAREYCWFPRFGSWNSATNHLKVLYTQVMRSAKSQYAGDFVLDPPFFNEEGTLRYFTVNTTSPPWNDVTNDFKMLTTDFVNSPPTPSSLTDFKCLSYLMVENGAKSDIHSGNDFESIYPVRISHFKSGLDGFMFSEPKGYPKSGALPTSGYVRISDSMNPNVPAGSMSVRQTRNYFPMVVDAFSNNCFYFAAGKNVADDIGRCGSLNMARHDETVNTPTPVSGDYFHIRKYDNSTIYYITTGKCYDWWPSVTYDNNLVVYMSDKADVVSNQTRPEHAGLAKLHDFGRWGIFIIPTRTNIVVPVPDKTVLNRVGNETPPFNPPLKEDNTYAFKAKSDSGMLLSIDNGTPIVFNWYLIDHITGATVSPVWNAGTGWGAWNAVPDLTVNDPLLDSPLGLDLTGVVGESIYPYESDDIAAHLFHNLPQGLDNNFLEGGEFKLGFVIYYRKEGLLTREVGVPLKFAVQAIDSPDYPVICFQVKSPVQPPGGYREDQAMIFTCETHIDYGDITPTGDGSEAHDGVVPGTVQYQWHVDRWDPGTTSYVLMYREPAYTPIPGTGTAVNSFSYSFKTPYKNPGHYKVGIDFKWQEAHWIPDYAPVPYDTNINLGIPNETEDETRFILDTSYNNIDRHGVVERNIQIPFWHNAKMHEDDVLKYPWIANFPFNPSPPPTYMPQIVRDATISFTFEVEDMTPPEIAILPANSAPLPAHAGTTGDTLSFEVWVRDNNPFFPMNINGSVSFHRELTPAAFVPASNYWQDTGMLCTGISPVVPSGWPAAPSLTNYKWVSDWYKYEVSVEMPHFFKGTNIYKYTVIALDGSPAQNKNSGWLSVTHLVDDASDNNYYPTAPDTQVASLEWACSDCFGDISVDDNDLPSISVCVKPSGVFSILGYREATYHAASLWDTGVDTSGYTITQYPTDSLRSVFMVHPLDPNSVLIPVPPHPKVNSFPEDLLLKYYIQFKDNCYWKGDTLNGMMTGSYNFKPIFSVTNDKYSLIHDPEFVGGIREIPDLAGPYPNNSVVTSLGLPVPISLDSTSSAYQIPFFEHMFREPNDLNDDGVIDPGEPVYTIEVGVADDSGNTRIMELVFPITSIPVFINSMEEKSSIMKRK